MPTPSGWNRAKWNKANADLANRPFEDLFEPEKWPVNIVKKQLEAANELIDALTREISVLTVEGSEAFRRCLPPPQAIRDTTDGNLTVTLSIAEWKRVAEVAGLFEDLMIRHPEQWEKLRQRPT